MGFVIGAVEHFVARDDAFHIEAAQRFVHGDHADVFAGLHDTREHEGFAFPDAVGDGGRVDEEFEGEHPAGAIGARHELLGEDSAQRLGNHDADLVALVGLRGEDSSRSVGLSNFGSSKELLLFFLCD